MEVKSMNDKRVIYTITAKDYLANAICLGRSIKKNNTERFFIFLADEITEEEIFDFTDEFKIITQKDIKFKNYKEMAYKYDILEFTTSLKPIIAEFLYREYGYEQIVYFDSDIYVFQSLEDVFKELEIFDFLITPHILCPKKSPIEIQKTFLQNGIYNMGFFGVSIPNGGLEILEWWKEKMISNAYNKPIEGLYTDQKWVDLVNTSFDKVKILKNAAYNIGWWNLQERTLSQKEDSYYVNGSLKVVFFHFSGFKIGNYDCLERVKKYINTETENVVKSLFSNYERELVSCEYMKFIKMSYAYDQFNNGEKITKLHRRLFGKLIDMGYIFNDPFSVDIGTYYDLLRKNKMLIGKKDSDKLLTRKNINGLSQKEKMIHSLLMLTKKLIGFKRYEVLIRYMTHELCEDKQYFLLKGLDDVNCKG